MLNSYLLYTQKLEGEYKESFEKIDMYVGARQIRDHIKEEMMSNLLDIFLSAQEEGVPVQKITGKNIEAFCKEFCVGYGFKESLMNSLEHVKVWVYLAFFTSVLDMIIMLVDFFGGTVDNLLTYRSEMDLPVYCMYILALCFCDVLTGYVVRKVMFRCGKLMRKGLNLCRFAVALLLLVIFILYGNRVDGILLPTWISFLVSGGLTILCVMATKDVRKKAAENQISFKEYCKMQGTK